MAFSKNRRLAQIISDVNGNLSVQGITVPTQSASDNDTSAASTAYVTTAISSLIDSAPDTLNTLNEIAAALNDDANFNTTVTNSIAAKLPLAGGTMTGALTVNVGTANVAAKFQSTDAGSFINLVDNSSGTFGALIGAEGDDVVFSPNNVEAMRILSDGKVGIGTTSPASLLSVQGDGFGIRIDGTANTSRGLLLRSTGTAEGQIQTDGNMHFIQEDANRYMRFSTANTERMRIDTNGNIGIGTTSPSVPLDVSGHVRFGDGGTAVAVDLNATVRAAIKINGTEKLTIKADGKVGIGTTSPLAEVDIRASEFIIHGGNTTKGPGIFLGDTNFSNTSYYNSAPGIGAVGPYGGVSAGLGFYYYASQANSRNEGMRLDSDGNIQLGTAIGSTIYNSGLNIVMNKGTTPIVRLRNGTGNKLIAFMGDNNVEYGYLGLDASAGAANLMIEATDNRSIRQRAGGISVELTDGATSGTAATTVDTGTMSIANSDINSSTLFTQRYGRYLQSNGTGWGSSDGLMPALVISKDGSATNDRGAPGIILHNQNNTNDVYGPSLSWGSRSTSGSYNTSYAWIIGKPVGNGPDSNWKAGELEIYTQGTGYVADKPAIRVTQDGYVQRPKMDSSSGNDAAFWARGTSNPSFTGGGQRGIIFTTLEQGAGYSTTTGRYTTPVAGWYSFTTNVRIDSYNGGGYMRIAFFTGTAETTTQSGYGQGHAIYGPGSYSANYYTMSTAWQVYLQENVQVGVAVIANTGSFTAHQESNFTGILIG